MFQTYMQTHARLKGHAAKAHDQIPHVIIELKEHARPPKTRPPVWRPPRRGS